MKGRIYDPLPGRFLQPDPTIPAAGFSQSWNRYAYVLNNPLNLTDPSGYKPCEFKDDLRLGGRCEVTFAGSGVRNEAELAAVMNDFGFTVTGRGSPTGFGADAVTDRFAPSGDGWRMPLEMALGRLAYLTRKAKSNRGLEGPTVIGAEAKFTKDQKVEDAIENKLALRILRSVPELRRALGEARLVRDSSRAIVGDDFAVTRNRVIYVPPGDVSLNTIAHELLHVYQYIRDPINDNANYHQAEATWGKNLNPYEVSARSIARKTVHKYHAAVRDRRKRSPRWR